MSRQQLLQRALGTLARQAAAASSSGAPGKLASAAQAGVESATASNFARSSSSSNSSNFPWAKVSLGFAAAGIMTVSEVPSAGCTANVTTSDVQATAKAPVAAGQLLSGGGAAAAASQQQQQRHKVVFVLGGPGSGKGTQCLRLVEEFGVQHLSAGDLLRAHIKSGSAEGQMVADMIKQGQIVPSHVTISLLQRAMDDSGKHKFLIDGFPRNEENRASFEAQTGIAPDLVLFFDCPEAVMERRLLGRNEGRTDDNIDTIRKRFKVFIESSLPVIQHYEASGKVARIDADRAADDIYREVRRLFLEF